MADSSPRERAVRSILPARKLLASRSALFSLPSFLLLTQFREYAVILQRRGIARGLLAAGDVAEQAAHDLARARLGQGFREANLIRARQGADLLDDMVLQLLLQLV